MINNKPILINSHAINSEVIFRRLRGMVEKNNGFNSTNDYITCLKCFENSIIHCQPASFGSHFIMEHHNDSEFDTLLINALSFVWQAYKLANKIDRSEHFYMKYLNNFTREYNFIFTEGTFGKDYKVTYESSLRIQCTKAEIVLTTLWLMCHGKNNINPKDIFNKYMSWAIKIIQDLINHQAMLPITKIMGTVYILEIVYNAVIEDKTETLMKTSWVHYTKTPFMIDVVHGNDVRLATEGIKSHLSYCPRLLNENEKTLPNTTLFYNPVYCEYMVRIMTEDYQYLFKPSVKELMSKEKLWYRDVLTELSKLQMQTNYKFERIDSIKFSYTKLPVFTKESIAEIKENIRKIMPEVNATRVIMQFIIDGKDEFDEVTLT